MTQSHTPTPQSPLTVFISRNGEQLKAGVVCFRKSPQGGGWQFVPTTCAHQPSRKLWDRPTDAIPKWVGPYTVTDPNVGEGLALWQRLNKLTYRYGFDSPEARDIGTASTMVKSHDALMAALRRSLNWLSSYPGGCALGAFDEARAALDAVDKAQ